MDTLLNENITGVNNEGAHPNQPLKYLAASSIIGDKVHNDDNEHLGKIADIMIDLGTGKIEYVVIEFGGFLTIGTKLFAIPFTLLKVDGEKKQFVLNQSRDMLEKAPGFDMNHWPETNFHAEEAYWGFMGQYQSKDEKDTHFYKIQYFTEKRFMCVLTGDQFCASKGATLASVNNITTGAVESVKAKSGKGLANEGSNVDYNEER